MNRQRNKRESSPGFTLIELLMVVSVIAILALLALVVLRSAQDDARATRTTSIIAQCRIVLQNKLEMYETRRAPFSFQSFGTTFTGLPSMAQIQHIRNRTLMEWILAEMPSYFEEVEMFPGVQSRPGTPTGVAGEIDYWPDDWATHYTNNCLKTPTSGMSAMRQALNTSPNVSGLYVPNDYAGNGLQDDDNVRASEVPLPPGEIYPLRYNPSLRSINKPLNGQVTNPSTGSPYTLFDHSVIEGAECLYAILYNTWDNDRRGTHFLNPGEIDDLDGDGRREVLDAWGDPVYFTITVRTIDDRGNPIDRNMDSAFDYLDAQLDPDFPAEIHEYEITIRSLRDMNF